MIGHVVCHLSRYKLKVALNTPNPEQEMLRLWLHPLSRPYRRVGFIVRDIRDEKWVRVFSACFACVALQDFGVATSRRCPSPSPQLQSVHWQRHGYRSISASRFVHAVVYVRASCVRACPSVSTRFTWWSTSTPCRPTVGGASSFSSSTASYLRPHLPWLAAAPVPRRLLLLPAGESNQSRCSCHGLSLAFRSTLTRGTALGWCGSGWARHSNRCRLSQLAACVKGALSLL
jgi:hypothetical protein